MSVVDGSKTTSELMQLAADVSNQRVALTQPELDMLVAILKQRAIEELEYGQEIECENVRLIRRVTGAVGLYFK